MKQDNSYKTNYEDKPLHELSESEQIDIVNIYLNSTFGVQLKNEPIKTGGEEIEIDKKMNIAKKIIEDTVLGEIVSMDTITYINIIYNLFYRLPIYSV